MRGTRAKGDDPTSAREDERGRARARPRPRKVSNAAFPSRDRSPPRARDSKNVRAFFSGGSTTRKAVPRGEAASRRARRALSDGRAPTMRRLPRLAAFLAALGALAAGALAEPAAARHKGGGGHGGGGHHGPVVVSGEVVARACCEDGTIAPDPDKWCPPKYLRVARECCARQDGEYRRRRRARRRSLLGGGGHGGGHHHKEKEKADACVEELIEECCGEARTPSPPPPIDAPTWPPWPPWPAAPAGPTPPPSEPAPPPPTTNEPSPPPTTNEPSPPPTTNEPSPPPPLSTNEALPPPPSPPHPSPPPLNENETTRPVDTFEARRVSSPRRDGKPSARSRVAAVFDATRAFATRPTPRPTNGAERANEQETGERRV